MRAWLLLVLGVLAACPVHRSKDEHPRPASSAARGEVERSGVPDDTPSAPALPWVESLPNAGPPSPMRIDIENPTGSRVALDMSYGPAAPFSLVSQDHHFGPLFLDQEEETLRSVACDCPCDEARRCRECPPPPPRITAIRAGGRHAHLWNGYLRRYRHESDGDFCFDRFAAPPGRYVLRVCDETLCGRTELVLPAPSARLRMGTDVERTACPLPAFVHERAVRNVLFAMHGSLPERTAKCTGTATCVQRSALASQVEAARAEPCTVWVVPEGRRLAVELLLPLPAEVPGPDRFTHWLDADAAETIDVFWER